MWQGGDCALRGTGRRRAAGPAPGITRPPRPSRRSARSAVPMPSPAQTIRHGTSRSAGPAASNAASIHLSLAIWASIGSSASGERCATDERGAASWRIVTRRGHLGHLPVAAHPLSGLELGRVNHRRLKPAERRLGKIDPRSTASLSLQIGDEAVRRDQRTLCPAARSPAELRPRADRLDYPLPLHAQRTDHGFCSLYVSADIRCHKGYDAGKRLTTSVMEAE